MTSKTTITSANVETVRETLPIDMREHAVASAVTWQANGATFLVLEDNTAAICHGGESSWGTWDPDEKVVDLDDDDRAYGEDGTLARYNLLVTLSDHASYGLSDGDVGVAYDGRVVTVTFESEGRDRDIESDAGGSPEALDVEVAYAARDPEGYVRDTLRGRRPGGYAAHQDGVVYGVGDTADAAVTDAEQWTDPQDGTSGLDTTPCDAAAYAAFERGERVNGGWGVDRGVIRLGA